MSQNQSNAAANASGETKINFRIFRNALLRYWWVTALCVIVLCGAAFLVLKKTNTTYSTFAMVMFNQNEDDDSAPKGMLGSLMASFSMGNSGVNVTDEIIRMQSHDAVKRVVKELDLHKEYSSTSSFFRKPTIYFQNSPLEIETAPGVLDTIEYDTYFKLKIKDKGRKMHLVVKQGIYRTVFDDDIPRLPYTVKTPLASFTISPTSFYRPEHNMTFEATIKNYDEAAKDEFEKIDTYLSEKKSNAVTIKVDDDHSKRARAIANTTVELYNQYSVADRSAQSRATLEFLNDRLLGLYGDLEHSGSGIAAYKERNMLVDPAAEAEYIMKTKSGAEANLVEHEAQLGVLNMLRDFLSSESNRTALIPITAMPGTGNNSMSINEAIKDYNELVLELLRVQESAKGNNFAMRQLENQITALRSNMISSLDRSISASKIAIARLSKESNTVNTRISDIPRMEQELTNMMRDNEIKNRIYAYLLQKREEAEVKLARTLPTAKIIDEAWTNTDTKRPKKALVLIGVFIVSLLVGCGIVYMLCRKKMVTGKKDEVKDEEQEIKEEIG